MRHVQWALNCDWGSCGIAFPLLLFRKAGKYDDGLLALRAKTLMFPHLHYLIMEQRGFARLWRDSQGLQGKEEIQEVEQGLRFSPTDGLLKRPRPSQSPQKPSPASSGLEVKRQVSLVSQGAFGWVLNTAATADGRVGTLNRCVSGRGERHANEQLGFAALDLFSVVLRQASDKTCLHDEYSLSSATVLQFTLALGSVE